MNPETGYVTYIDVDVSDFEDIAYSRAWPDNHDSEEIEAIPDDFERP